MLLCVLQAGLLVSCGEDEQEAMARLQAFNYRQVKYCEVTHVDTTTQESTFYIRKSAEISALADALKRSYITDWESTPAKYGVEVYAIDSYMADGTSNRVDVLKTIYGYPIIQSYGGFIIRNDSILNLLKRYESSEQRSAD
ncbi:hypothetical protein GCM10027594_35100 [Hymenobacter agri]